MDLDLLLKQYGVRYEDLNTEERSSVMTMVEAMKQQVLTVDKIRDYISQMKFSVEEELAKYDLGSKQDIFLKARLRNYMLLEAVLMSPERAKRQLQQAISNLK